MIISSMQELEKLFEESICVKKLDEESYSKSRYIDQKIFDHLINYELIFEPFIEIAKHCSMRTTQIMRSNVTNRFYIGFVNLGGHGTRFEVRPVRITEVKNFNYMKKMLNNYAEELHRGIDLMENYEI